MVRKPRRLAADRARRFCAAVSAEAEGRASAPWWSSIDVVARRLGVSYDEAAVLAEACALEGLVKHDQSQHTKADRRTAVRPHSVALAGPGWALLREKTK